METTELRVSSTSRHQSPAYRPVHYVSSNSWGESPVYRPVHEARVLCIVHSWGLSPVYRPLHEARVLCIIHFMRQEYCVSSTSWGESPVYRPLHEVRVLCIVLVKQWESIQFIRTVFETLLVTLIRSCDDDGDDNPYPNPNQCKLVFIALWRLTADLRLCKKSTPK